MTPEFPKPVIDAQHLASVLLTQDPQVRNSGIESLFVARCPNDNFAYYFAMQSKQNAAELYALGIIASHFDEVGDPIEVLQSFIPSAASNESMQFAISDANRQLSGVVGPEEAFRVVSDLDPTIYWAVHCGIPMFLRVNKEWAQESADLHQYLNKLLRCEYPLQVREQMFYAIAKIFPYQSDILKNAIKDLLEDYHEYMRGLAKYYWELWELKDKVVTYAEMNSL